MKYLIFFVFLFLQSNMLFSQTTWEKSFESIDTDYLDFSVTTSQDGSEDIVLGGSIDDQEMIQAHIVRLNSITGEVIFEKTLQTSEDVKILRIQSFNQNGTTGYIATGFTEYFELYVPIAIKIDEEGKVIDFKRFDESVMFEHGVGLDIKVAHDGGFIIVGLLYEDPENNFLRKQKAGFVMKLSDSLEIEWQYTMNYDPVDSTWPYDMDVCSQVVLTDQGYFITGSKNILPDFGLNKGGVMAIMLDTEGNLLWDASYFRGNLSDVGASAVYNESEEKIHVLTNYSITHHFGLTTLNAISGEIDTSLTMEALGNEESIDSYGYTLLQSSDDVFTIAGRKWTEVENMDNLRENPLFIVDYNMKEKEFSKEYVEPTYSDVFYTYEDGMPFPNNTFRSFYYPQNIVSLSDNRKAVISYYGHEGENIHMIVRTFLQSEDQNYFCDEGKDVSFEASNLFTVFYDSLVNLSSYESESTDELGIFVSNFSKDVEECFSVIDNDTEIDSNSKINIFPNPSSNRITIQWSDEKQVSNVKLLSITGQELRNQLTHLGQMQVEWIVNDIPSGVYLIQVINNNLTVQTEKIVIQK